MNGSWDLQAQAASATALLEADAAEAESYWGGAWVVVVGAWVVLGAAAAWASTSTET